MRPVILLPILLLLSCSALAQSTRTSAAAPQSIVIDLTAPSHPFPHFWEQAFGSGRAILSLRESYRSDLRVVKAATDFKYVRFHAILHDEVGVYEEDEHGNPVYNFTYVGQIYDGLLGNGVRPIVEISFMPKKLAARQDLHPFWYKQNVSPPKDYGKWDMLVRKFGEFLVGRYGIDEVSRWYFEVWNEPNIDFWSGEPKQTTYFELYDHTAKALKSVDSRLRIGGPASSSAHWVEDFIAHTTANQVPVDFVSTHGYADDSVEDYFGTSENIPIEKRMCRAVEKVHNQIKSSAKPELPLLWTEWNVSGYGPLNAGETSYAASAISESIRACDGLVELMSFWTFSDVFEENGPATRPLNGGFGLVGVWGIKKPSFYAFSLLHKLGDTRIANLSENVIVTSRSDGSVAIAIWNLYPPDHLGSDRIFDLQFQGLAKNRRATVSRLDQDHSNTRAAYERLGQPRYPTEAQVKEINRETALPAPQPLPIQNGHLSLNVPANGFALLEISN